MLLASWYPRSLSVSFCTLRDGTFIPNTLWPLNISQKISLIVDEQWTLDNRWYALCWGCRCLLNECRSGWSRSGICAVGSPWSELTTQNELRSESAPSRWKEKSLCRLGFPLPWPSLYKRCLSNKMYFRCLAESRNVAEVQLRRCDPDYLKEKQYWEIVAVSHGNTPKPKWGCSFIQF